MFGLRVMVFGGLVWQWVLLLIALGYLLALFVGWRVDCFKSQRREVRADQREHGERRR